MKRIAILSVIILIIISLALVPELYGIESKQHEGLSTSKKMLQSKQIPHPLLITEVDTGQKKLVALTFDDGPDPRFTPKVLDILKKYKIKATFFIVGRSAEKYPKLVYQEVYAGHEIENHTYTHPDLQKDSGLRINEEILRNQYIIEKMTHRRPIYFRPPKKLFNNEVIDLADTNGYKTILWSIGVEHASSKTINNMAQRVIDHAHPGMIILAHDGRLNRTRTVEALPLIIKAYQQKGYKFVTMEDLMKNSIK